jgi:acetylornithine deacetylase/succinyl-diaminopimelate desuccinylase-like protein
MAVVINALREELWPRLEERTHPSFYPSTASVNMIFGGVKENVVPDRCEIYVDRRLVPGESPEACVAEIREIASRAVQEIPGLTVTASFDGEYRPASVADPSSPLVLAMQQANAYLGLATDLTGFSMATDGRFFAAAGYPTVIYGPGDSKLAHIPDEWVAIDEVIEATRAYALAASILLGDRSE